MDETVWPGVSTHGLAHIAISLDWFSSRWIGSMPGFYQEGPCQFKEYAGQPRPLFKGHELHVMKGGVSRRPQVLQSRTTRYRGDHDRGLVDFPGLDLGQSGLAWHGEVQRDGAIIGKPYMGEGVL